MDLREKGAPSRQPLTRKFSQRTVEYQRVPIRHEQRQSRFRSDDMRVHAAFFREWYIRWIANQPPDRRHPHPGLAVQEIKLMKRNRSLQIDRIASRDIQGIAAQIRRMNGHPWQSSGQRDTYTPAAGSDIEQTTRRTGRLRYILNHPFYQFFGLGSRYQYPLIDKEPHPGKPAFAQHILNGAIRQQLVPVLMIHFQYFRR